MWLYDDDGGRRWRLRKARGGSYVAERHDQRGDPRRLRSGDRGDCLAAIYGEGFRCGVTRLREVSEPGEHYAGLQMTRGGAR